MVGAFTKGTGMAEHVKLMGIAAKAGVTMALLALVAGVAGNATGRGTGVMPAAQVLNGRSALKLKVKGLSPELKHDLRTIQTDFNFVSKVMEEEGIFSTSTTLARDTVS